MRLLLPVALLLAASCKGPLASLTRREGLVLPYGELRIATSPTDHASAVGLATAAQGATGALSRWGRLREGVTVYVLPSHAALERVAGHRGADWLRGWARYDELFVQAPATWGPRGVSQREVDELVLHELSHCLMFQLSARRDDWRSKGIPAWFREGFATFNADQGYRWPSLEQLSERYEKEPTFDPLGDSDSLYEREPEIAYAAGHHAFSFLVRRYGDDAVRTLLSRMSAGGSFTQAFPQAFGITADQLAQDFRTYLRLRGYRGGRLRHPPLLGGPKDSTAAPVPDEHGGGAR